MIYNRSLIALLSTALLSGFVVAQPPEPHENWKVGDRLTFDWVRNGESKTIIDNVLAVTDSEVCYQSKVGDRTYDSALSVPSMAYAKGMCLANGQSCDFSPAYVWVQQPMAQGKTWSGSTQVTGETFIADVKYERTVEGIEMIKTPAGQFDAWKVSISGRIKVKEKIGGGESSAREEATDWIARINGRTVTVRTEYENTYGERFSRELLSVELK